VARIAGAEVVGDTPGSTTELIFSPGRVTSGTYDFAIGTAGATTLVLQALMAPLLFAPGQSTLVLRGGTHVPFSPSWHYLDQVFAPTLARLGGGIDLELELERCGFYPRGGGSVRCRVRPAAGVTPLRFETRGRLLRVSGCSGVGNLPRSIAERQRRAALERLGSLLGGEVPLDIEVRELSATGEGIFLFLRGEYEQAVAGFTSLGARGKPAEVVGQEGATELLRHHETGMPIDPHLADQLVPYLALASEESVMATSRITGHLETNLDIVGCFLQITAEKEGDRESCGSCRTGVGHEGGPPLCHLQLFVESLFPLMTPLCSSALDVIVSPSLVNLVVKMILLCERFSMHSSSPIIRLVANTRCALVLLTSDKVWLAMIDAPAKSLHAT
jgi:RNA 3'-terminal phosphate cyclase (ATP)